MALDTKIEHKKLQALYDMFKGEDLTPSAEAWKFVNKYNLKGSFTLEKWKVQLVRDDADKIFDALECMRRSRALDKTKAHPGLQRVYENRAWEILTTEFEDTVFTLTRNGMEFEVSVNREKLDSLDLDSMHQSIKYGMNTPLDMKFMRLNNDMESGNEVINIQHEVRTGKLKMRDYAILMMGKIDGKIKQTR